MQLRWEQLDGTADGDVQLDLGRRYTIGVRQDGIAHLWCGGDLQRDPDGYGCWRDQLEDTTGHGLGSAATAATTTAAAAAATAAAATAATTAAAAAAAAAGCELRTQLYGTDVQLRWEQLDGAADSDVQLDLGRRYTLGVRQDGIAHLWYDGDLQRDPDGYGCWRDRLEDTTGHGLGTAATTAAATTAAAARDDARVHQQSAGDPRAERHVLG